MLRVDCTLAPDKLIEVETRGVTGDQVFGLRPTFEWVRGP